jgi:hypothetical protein
VSSKRRHGPMDQCPKPIDLAGEERPILVVRRHNHAEPLKASEIFC